MKKWMAKNRGLLAQLGVIASLSLAATSPVFAAEPTAQQHVDAGLDALAKGDNSAAIASFRLAVRADPDDRGARRLLADALRRVDRCADALAQYQILQSTGADDDARRGEVQCLRALGQNDTALRIVEDVLGRHPLKDDQSDPLAIWALAEQKSLKSVGAVVRTDPATKTEPVLNAQPLEQPVQTPIEQPKNEQPERPRIVPEAGPMEADTPATMDAQGEALFAAARYPEAAAWFELALTAQPTAERAWKLAMARWAMHDGLQALVAIDKTLQLQPDHKAAQLARPLLADWVRTRGQTGNAVPMAPEGRSIRMAVLQALVDGDDVLARQLLPLWRNGLERGVVADLVQAELWLREERVNDADKLLRAILAKQPSHPAALKALAEIVIRRGDLQQARAMLGLPLARIANGEDPNADLYRFILRRRAEFQQQLRMAVDPGVKPLPSLPQQLAEMDPPTPSPPPQVEPTPEPVKPTHGHVAKPKKPKPHHRKKH